MKSGSIARRGALIACVLAGLVVPVPLHAWDDSGHMVIARIAWRQLTQETRRALMTLLRRAPADAGLRQLRPTTDTPAEQDRRFFMLSSVWPDMVRSREFPQRREKYDRADWHFVNFFWEQRKPGGSPRKLERAPTGELVNRLKLISDSLAISRRPDSVRAVEIAWLLHLVGDLHQPLHASSRVTAQEPEGDRGGNTFALDSLNRNLHSFWDGIMRRKFPQRPGEDLSSYAERVAEKIMERHPRKLLQKRVKPGAIDVWAAESFETAMRMAYPANLQRGQRPPAEYEDRVWEMAAPAMALAGYRLAELLNQKLGSS